MLLHHRPSKSPQGSALRLHPITALHRYGGPGDKQQTLRRMAQQGLHPQQRLHRQALRCHGRILRGRGLPQPHHLLHVQILLQRAG